MELNDPNYHEQIEQARAELRTLIDQVNDLDALESAKVYLTTPQPTEYKEGEPIVSYGVDGAKLTEKELLGELDSRLERMKAGAFVTLEELEAKVGSWRRRT